MRSLSRRELLSFSSAGNSADPLIHIASLIVQATDAGCSAVRECVAAMPAAELHDTAHPNKLVVVLEASDARSLADATSELQQITGVLTVSIVAHLTERASALDETDESTTVP